MAFEVSFLVPDTNPPTIYGVDARNDFGDPIIFPDTSVLRFDVCETCPGPEAEFAAPEGYIWVNFKSQSMESAIGTFTFVPHPTGVPGTPLPSMFWVSDTLDDDFGETVDNLLSLFPDGPVGTDSVRWGDVKVMFFTD